MAGKKGHAAYVASTAAPGPAFLPAVGDMYWVDTLLYTPADKAHRRPAVVLEVPEPAHSPIRIATRTTDLEVRGVRHAAQPQWGLEDGVFSDLNHVKKDEWCSPRVTPIGALDGDTMNAVRERFG
jgi:mRNA-degrading endonuclease toxin of MazEF toxin-antitoxin module